MRKFQAIIAVIAMVVVSVLLLSFGDKENNSSIRIGTQTWAIANLDVSTFRNGDAIHEARTNEEWVKAGENGEAAWCYYDNDPVNKEKYGKLYNWYAVNDSRGLAPNGWHVPSDTEWATLTFYLGGETLTACLGGQTDAGKKMKATSGWKDHSNGNNKSGFAGLPGGCRHYYGSFNHIGSNGYWWSSTQGKISLAWDRGLTSNKGYVNGINYDGRAGYSVRCIKD